MTVLSRRRFLSIQLLAVPEEASTLLSVLPHDLDGKANGFLRGEVPATYDAPGMNMAYLDAEWCIQQIPNGVIFLYLRPMEGLSAEEIRQFEQEHNLAAKPQIMFGVMAHPDDDPAVTATLQQNLQSRQPWDTGLQFA